MPYNKRNPGPQGDLPIQPQKFQSNKSAILTFAGMGANARLYP